MVGPDRLRRAGQQLLTHSTAEQTEVVLIAGTTELTRFANSGIHQNVAEQNVQVRVRSVLGKKVGVALVNSLERSALRRACQSSVESARLQPDNPHFCSLPETHSAPIAAYQQGHVTTPPQRAKAIDAVCRLAHDQGLIASGAYSASVQEIAVVNSLGIDMYTNQYANDLSIVVMGEDSSGYASGISVDVAEIDVEDAAREAVDKAVRSRRPLSVAPGRYPVVLEEYAVGELLTYLSWLGFGATAVEEGRSFMSGKLGQTITGSNITIWDDGLDPSGLPMPFDYEGVPKQRVDLIRNGVAISAVYDSYSAAREHRSSTGHALPAPNPSGAFASNVFLRGGPTPRDKMAESVGRGLWVTRLHYVNPVQPLQTVLTGMTRDGTFLIENGEVTRGVKNLRFTENILQAFRQATAIGSDTRLLRGLVGVIRVPALCLESFAFTGTTDS
jgi:PmbA protein